jgi:DNA-binding winged helix-turn-helix (wHTH) protein
MAPTSKPAIARFGSFEVDLKTGELRKSGIRLRLPDQAFQILNLLLENSGELVSREDLRLRLWSGDTFVDFERGLNRAVNKLREALCDSADVPRFIETVPRRGYRFIAPLLKERRDPADRASSDVPRSLAIVPFNNASGSADADYLCVGLPNR